MMIDERERLGCALPFSSSPSMPPPPPPPSHCHNRRIPFIPPPPPPPPSSIFATLSRHGRCLPPSPSLVLESQEENVEGAQEFQEFVTHRLDTLQESINVMVQRWETRWNQHVAISEQRWGEQQDWHQKHRQWQDIHQHNLQQNRQNWEDQQMWRQVEHQFWQKQSLHSNEQTRFIAQMHQGQRDMMKMMQNLNTCFLPLPKE